jgi:hypothetical protein
MAATSRIFPFLPSFLNSIFAQHQFNIAATSFTHSLKIHSCRFVFELVI